MVRLLKEALDEEPEDFPALLTEEIMKVDEQLLQIERATNEVSGKEWLESSNYWQFI